MKEVSEQDRPTEDAARARKKRITQKVGHVLCLANAAFWLFVFIAVLSTGYISWVGTVVGVSVIGPWALSSVAGIAGSRRLERLLSRLLLIAIILTAVAAAAVLLWPEDKGTWRPYTFDDELAAIEAGRAVADHDNAAPRYESALAAIDVNDRPDFVFDGSSVRDEFSHHPWRAADHPGVSRWLDSHEATIGQLLQIGGLEKCRWPVYANSDCHWTVPYKKLSYGMQLLAMTGNRDLGRGQSPAALEKSLCLLRNADHLYQQTHELDFRYAFHAERAALEILRHLLVASESSPQDIERIAQRLPTAADTWHEDIARLLEFDKLRFVQIMASVYEINEQGRIRFSASVRCLIEGAQEQDNSALKGRAWRLYWLMNMPLNPEGVWDMTAKESASLAGFLRPGPMLRAPAEPDDSLWSVLGFAGKVLSNLARSYAHEICLSEFLYANFGEYYAQQIVRRRGTWLVLGLRRYRDAHGAWPETLDAITEYVPAEAFVDPTSKGAFVYTRDGDSFRLYSKGVNRIDEGGRRGYVKALDKSEDDILLWPPPPPPEPPHEESIKKELTDIYGREYAEKYLRDNRSDKTMIVDRIENARLYFPLHKGFAKAFAVLADPALANKPDGRYDIDGNDVYYIIQHYTTKPVDPNKLESHAKYIDIQVVLAGEELLGYSPTAGLEVVQPYDEAKDIMFYRVPADITWIRLEPGRFCLLYPQDAHLPSCQITGPAPVHKVVFKIRLGK